MRRPPSDLIDPGRANPLRDDRTGDGERGPHVGGPIPGVPHARERATTSVRFAILLLLSTLVAVASACSDAPPPEEALLPPDAGSESAATFAVEVDPASVSLKVALGGTTTQVYRAFSTIGGQRTDITSGCAWSLDGIPSGRFSDATLTITPSAGTGHVIATCGGSVGRGDIEVQLTGSLIVAGAPANAADLFAAAKPGSDKTRAPTVEYPLDGAISPVNIPSIDAQWTTAGNDLFHLQLGSKRVSIDLYTKEADGQLSPNDWSAVVGSAAGEALTVSVEGMTIAKPTEKLSSAPATVRISRDAIESSAIYYWASSVGSIMTQVFGETGAPTPVKADCTSCHSLSRAGTRIGYSRCVAGDCDAGEWIGFMRYDAATKNWKDTLDANTKRIRGSFTTFAPPGYPFASDDKSVVIIAESTGRLGLYDPDTGNAVASNIGERATMGGKRGATMPDWSPDGKTIVYVTPSTPTEYLDVSKGSIAAMSYAFNAGKHELGEAKLIVDGNITLASGVYNNFFFPSISNDGKLVIFNAARTPWRNETDATAPGQRLMLADVGGAWKVDLANVNGKGDLDTTWAHWAPGSMKSDYIWFVLSSQRMYGHRVTPALSPRACLINGAKQCKQIWIGAIERAKLPKDGASAADPSGPPMWLPGQDTKAANLSPYWTVPTTTIPR